GLAMIRYAVAAICAVFVLSTAAHSDTSMQCKTVSKEQIAALFDRWNNSLATHDAAKVTANYAPDAVLLATVSNTPRTNTAAIKDYFVHFLESNPRGAINTRTIHIGCNTAYDVGTYTFTLSGKAPAATQTVKARYSYIYELRNGQWLIVHHHS